MHMEYDDRLQAYTAKPEDAGYLEASGRSLETCGAVRLLNCGDHPAVIREVELLIVELPAAAAGASLYAEGYSMLSQYGGTLGRPLCLTAYSDAVHYRLPQQENCFTVYNLLLLELSPDDLLLLGYASCRRFRGEFRLRGTRITAVLACEDKVLSPGESWVLEELILRRGPDRETLLGQLADRIAINHPRLPFAGIPSGWCSWYGYGPEVTQRDVHENLEAISRDLPELRYIQIDDGYQARMGDWLTPGASFAADMPDLCRSIRERGFEPAIWLAPFIAEEESQILRSHPEWFVSDENGCPLRSDRVTFGGWNRGPWYMLDGTHPEARAYISEVTSVMRQNWGCHYFKLDAVVWGAFPFGCRYDSKATSVEAYRLGMRAVLDGAGSGAFLLGGNSPLWPSLGVMHAMRVSGDIVRDWTVIRSAARETFLRNWQHNRLWINDPDCVVLENQVEQVISETPEMTRVTPEEFSFHVACIAASGGMVLSGDRMPMLTEKNRGILRKLLDNCGAAARFDKTCTIGRTDTATGQLVFIFNWEDEPRDMICPLVWPAAVYDYFTENHLGTENREIQLHSQPPHSGLVLRLERE